VITTYHGRAGDLTGQWYERHRRQAEDGTKKRKLAADRLLSSEPME